MYSLPYGGTNHNSMEGPEWAYTLKYGLSTYDLIIYAIPIKVLEALLGVQARRSTNNDLEGIFVTGEFFGRRLGYTRPLG